MNLHHSYWFFANLLQVLLLSRRRDTTHEYYSLEIIVMTFKPVMSILILSIFAVLTRVPYTFSLILYVVLVFLTSIVEPKNYLQCLGYKLEVTQALTIICMESTFTTLITTMVSWNTTETRTQTGRGHYAGYYNTWKNSIWSFTKEKLQQKWHWFFEN